jgi:DNA-binding NarL/FixJ family response regulator
MSDRTEPAARIFLIDDHQAVRDGLKLLFSGASYRVCGEAETRSEAFERIDGSGADLAIIDLSLGEESGFELIAEICRMGVAVLIYSMHEDAEMIQKSFTLGATGYVTKREKSAILRQAVADVLAGRRCVSPRAAQSMADRVLSAPQVHQEQLLSERERQIIALLGRGESNRDIAVALAISIRTVETHFVRIIAKFRLGGMKELRRHAIQNK